MAPRRCRCPAGHELKLWIARAGACDGCRRFVADGEQVMDCRACNWYLCGDCRPATAAKAMSMLDSLQNMVFGDMCLADPRGRVDATEIDVGYETVRAVEVEEPVRRAAIDVAAKAREAPAEEADDTATASPPESPVGSDAEVAAPVGAQPDFLVRELTDLLDLSAEPEVSRPLEKAVDPYDLSTLDFVVGGGARAQAAGVGVA